MSRAESTPRRRPAGCGTAIKLRQTPVIAISDGRLYDFFMELKGPALFFAPWRFPPKAERLIRLVESFAGLGYRTVIIDWGGLFPWSEKRFQGKWSYPEHAVVEAHTRALGKGLVLLPRFPFGSGMSTFLSDPAYRALRLGGIDPDLLDPSAPGAAKFVCDLLDDMRVLLPDLEGIYIDPVTGGALDERYLGELLDRIFPRLLEAAAGLPVVTAPHTSGSPATDGRCSVLPVEPDDFGQKMRDELPPTIETHLDSMPGFAAGVRIEGVEPEFSAELRGKFESLLRRLNGCRGLMQAAAEDSALPPGLGYPLARSRVILKTAIDEAEAILAGLSAYGSELEPALKPYVAPGVLSGWIRSRIDPVRDQLGLLKAKYRTVEAWIGTE